MSILTFFVFSFTLLTGARLLNSIRKNPNPFKKITADDIKERREKYLKKIEDDFNEIKDSVGLEILIKTYRARTIIVLFCRVTFTFIGLLFLFGYIK